MTPETGHPVTHHEEPEQEHQPSHWFQRLSALLFMIFCFELGLFLLIYPWTESWASNYFAFILPDRLVPVWQDIWVSPWFRGAVSGVGVVNLWVAVTELFEVFGRSPKGS